MIYCKIIESSSLKQKSPYRKHLILAAHTGPSGPRATF